MSDDTPDKVPEPPEDVADYELGTADDAIADDSSTRVVWVVDHERELKWWFELREQVPVRKKGNVLEDNATMTEQGTKVSNDYYIDMLEYMVVDWSGADDPDAPGIRELLTKAPTGNEVGNPVFEKLQNEVPPPVSDIDEAELNV
jgi:hypothetical protein